MSASAQPVSTSQAPDNPYARNAYGSQNYVFSENPTPDGLPGSEVGIDSLKTSRRI